MQGYSQTELYPINRGGEGMKKNILILTGIFVFVVGILSFFRRLFKKRGQNLGR
jgi:hypothetical protein